VFQKFKKYKISWNDHQSGWSMEKPSCRRTALNYYVLIRCVVCVCHTLVEFIYLLMAQGPSPSRHTRAGCAASRYQAVDSIDRCAPSGVRRQSCFHRTTSYKATRCHFTSTNIWQVSSTSRLCCIVRWSDFDTADWAVVKGASGLIWRSLNQLECKRSFNGEANVEMRKHHC